MDNRIEELEKKVAALERKLKVLDHQLNGKAEIDWEASEKRRAGTPPTAKTQRASS